MGEYQSKDHFERAREVLWGTPGFIVKQSTIISPGTSWLPEATWVVETVKTDEGAAIFLQSMSQEGGQRLVLPTKAVKAIWRHHDQVMAHARKLRAQRGADTRKQNKES